MYEILVLIVTLFQGAGGGTGGGTGAVLQGSHSTSMDGMDGVQDQFVSHSSQLMVSFTLQLMACMKCLC
jgi:hypothetical protein